MNIPTIYCENCKLQTHAQAKKCTHCGKDPKGNEKPVMAKSPKQAYFRFNSASYVH